jgi:hypothetical protein
MKARMWICVLMAVGIALAAATVANAGDNPKPRPFKGTLVGDVHWEILGEGLCPPQGDFITMSRATGELSHLGRTTMTENHCAGGDGLPVNGTLVFAAANGDKLWGTVVVGSCAWGEATETSFSETCNYAVNGGTGSFETASGSLHMTAWVTPTGEPLGPFPAQFIWVGTIRY